MNEAVETPGEPVEETSTLAEHEQAFSPEGNPPEPDVPVVPEPPVRHRAKSQQARADDVEAIARYTKELREAEAKVEVARLEGESERVYQVRKRAEMAKRALQPVKQETAQSTTPPERTVAIAEKSPTPAAPTTFTETEPKLDDFTNQPDPYGALVRAQAAYDRRKDAFEAQQQASQTAQTREQEQRHAAWTGWVQEQRNAHYTRMAAFLAETPHAKAVFEAMPDDLHMSPLMQAAMELHEQGPKMAYYLAQPQNRDFVDELLMQTTGQPVVDSEQRFNPLVATVQRRLLQRVQAADTRSAAPARPILVAPRPPNLVRTAPQTPSDTYDESGPLSAHEKQFGGRSRRR